MEPLAARGVSLWLVPEAAEAEPLAKAIASLASRLGSPVFAPHVTLRPALTGAADEIVERTGSLLSDLEVFSVTLGPLESRKEPFRRLFLPVAPTFRLVHAHALFRSAFAPEDDRPFEPHVSLAYGLRGAEDEAALAREAAGGLPQRVRLSALEVVRTEGPVEQWRSLARYELPAPASGQPRRPM
jgi:2'-5' RNA ligase